MTEIDTQGDLPLESYPDDNAPDKLVSLKAFSSSEKFVPISELET